MRLYRICPKVYLENYTGLGASYRDGGRWNHAGLPVMYFALSPSTALLEMANYLPSPRFVPATYRLGIYELPGRIPVDQLSDEQLPDDWAMFPYPASTQEIGSQWLKSNKKVGMLVPSAAVPDGLEHILLFNPAHKNSERIRLVRHTSNLYNKRMFSRI